MAEGVRKALNRGRGAQRRGLLAHPLTAQAATSPLGVLVVGEARSFWWPGPKTIEARAAYERARNSGLSVARSVVIGCIASFQDGWIFRKTLAKHIGICVRTVQRAITQGKEEGLIGVGRAKQNEIPPGASEPFACGWSHRWTIGWGEAYEAAKAAVARTRLARMAKKLVRTAPGSNPQQPAPQERSQRQWTASELDAELERIAAVKARPD
jgi:hypothetical protein